MYKPFLRGLLPVVLLFSGAAQALPVFINEIHYDNRGADTGEGVELTGVAGLDLSGWQLLFYNGSTQSVYKNVSLDGVFSNVSGGLGTLAFAIAGIQNGSPDGIALADNSNSIVQFLSYEGVITAGDGLAAGLGSEDILLMEDGQTPAGYSLQLSGTGYDYADFSWQAAPSSFGQLNAGQLIQQPHAQVGIPGVLGLVLSGLVLLRARS